MADEIDKESDKRDPRFVDELKTRTVIIGADDAPNFYSDSVVISTSLYDFKLHIRVAIRRNDSETTYRELCLLHISPPHFKKLVAVMAKNVELYEQLFGPITERPLAPAPKDVQ